MDPFEAVLNGVALEDLLGVGDGEAEVGGCQIGKTDGIFEIGGEDHDFRGDSLAQGLDLLQVRDG